MLYSSSVICRRLCFSDLSLDFSAKLGHSKNFLASFQQSKKNTWKVIVMTIFFWKFDEKRIKLFTRLTVLKCLKHCSQYFRRFVVLKSSFFFILQRNFWTSLNISQVFSSFTYKVHGIFLSSIAINAVQARQGLFCNLDHSMLLQSQNLHRFFDTWYLQPSALLHLAFPSHLLFMIWELSFTSPPSLPSPSSPTPLFSRDAQFLWIRTVELDLSHVSCKLWS